MSTRNVNDKSNNFEEKFIKQNIQWGIIILRKIFVYSGDNYCLEL